MESCNWMKDINASMEKYWLHWKIYASLHEGYAISVDIDPPRSIGWRTSTKSGDNTKRIRCHERIRGNTG